MPCTEVLVILTGEKRPHPLWDPGCPLGTTALQAATSHVSHVCKQAATWTHACQYTGGHFKCHPLGSASPNVHPFSWTGHPLSERLTFMQGFFSAKPAFYWKMLYSRGCLLPWWLPLGWCETCGPLTRWPFSKVSLIDWNFHEFDLYMYVCSAGCGKPTCLLCTDRHVFMWLPAYIPARFSQDIGDSRDLRLSTFPGTGRKESSSLSLDVLAEHLHLSPSL